MTSESDKSEHDRRMVVWQILEELHKAPVRPSLSGLVEGFKSRGLGLRISDIEGLPRYSDLNDDWSPAPLRDFLSKLLDGQYDSILDPFAGCGSLIVPLTTTLSIPYGIAVSRGHENYEAGQYISHDSPLEWFCDDPLLWLEHCSNRFDLIVCNPPWGWKAKHAKPIKGVSADGGMMVVLLAAMRLSDSGTGVFAVPDSCFWMRQERAVVRNLKRFGIAVDAYFMLPDGTVKCTTKMPAGVVILKRGEQGQVFVGEVSRNHDRTNNMLENYRARRAGREISFWGASGSR